MVLNARSAFASFGWAVGRQTRKAGQVGDEVRDLVDRVGTVWSSYFPAEQGYEVIADSPAGARHGVQLVVERGDFRAEVSVESSLDLHRRSLGHGSGPAYAVRMSGRALSAEMAQAELRGPALIARCRTVGAAAGVSLFGVICFLVIGTPNPVYVLAGLLMVVTLLVTTTAGGSLGAWVGERIAERFRERAEAGMSSDPRFQDDLRRWKSLARRLSGQRAVIAGDVLAEPFRSEPPALPAARPTSFSFSS